MAPEADREDGDAAERRFAVELARQLESRGLAGAALAREMGVSRAYVSGLATGRKAPSGPTVDRIAAAIGADARDRARLHRAAAEDQGFKLDLPDDF